MSDREMNVTIGTAITCALWGATWTLLVLGTLLESSSLHAWGLAFSASAATATIRCFLVRQDQALRNAFLLGRDSAQVPGVVTSMRPR